MKNYTIVLTGHSFTEKLTIERSDPNEFKVIEWLDRNMPNYYPVFYRATVYERGLEDGAPRVVGGFRADVVVKRLGP